jgi:hypothetical protein
VPGKLDRNLRAGHRAEDRGVNLLQEFCAVARVPQPEDVGFDAVATVLRVDGRFWVAEHSFCVQFKARSVRDLAYDHAAYKWLRALPLPLFIGSVPNAPSPGSCPSAASDPLRPGGRVAANHLLDLVSIDFFTVPTARFRVLFGLTGRPWTSRSFSVRWTSFIRS